MGKYQSDVRPHKSKTQIISVYNERKQRNQTIDKPELGNLWHFCYKNVINQSTI